MMANAYLVINIATITQGGIQLPGIKNDRLARVNVTRSSRKYLNRIPVTTSKPAAHIATGAGSMPKLELTPKSDRPIIPTGSK